MNRRTPLIAAVALLTLLGAVGPVTAAITETDPDPARPAEIDRIIPKEAVPAGVLDLLTGPQLLSVSRTGTGTGTVTSSPAGISCGTTCSASFTGTVTLTAVSSKKSTFMGWSGACSGTTTTCAVTMDNARSVTARFDLKRPAGGRKPR